ncbi:ParA family protein [Agarilytica rhodophyticola]|uniref:ParA family protein n=1 Tax=Agarilytica rhodophyticola TaxID=1737490 RepID=UPI000B341B6F|nr:ParA family protein [Agarilytica rhodophyticola]
MGQIFIANPKGGCGKTTISTQLAAYFATHGQRVLLADHDALKCSSDWLASRPDFIAKIESVAASVDELIDSDGVDWVVHDMPAAWSLDNVQNILHSHDYVLVPVLPSPNDIKACLRFLMKIYRSGILESGIRVGLIANRTRSNTRYFKILNAFLLRLKLPIVTELRDTQNYIRAMDEGLSIFDLPPSKVSRDLEQWAPIFEWLDKTA